VIVNNWRAAVSLTRDRHDMHQVCSPLSVIPIRV